jgi:hypothetical protein
MIEIDAFINGTSRNIKAETVSNLISQFAELITAEEQMIDKNLLEQLGFKAWHSMHRTDGYDLDVDDDNILQVILHEDGNVWRLFDKPIKGPETADELRTLIKTIGRKS